MIRRALALVLCTALTAATASALHVTGQLLAYQDGYVFFSTGDGFKVSPNVAVRDAAGAATSLAPRPRLYARAVFDASGTVTELDLSRAPLPPEMNFAEARRFAVAASTPAPNPDLAQSAPGTGGTARTGRTFTGRRVLVSFTVQVPPQTPLGSTVYMTTDVSGWNAQAMPMERIDALHFRVTQYLTSGTVFSYLYTRGSLQTEEIGENGLSRQPRQLTVNDSDVRAVTDVVYQWTDEQLGGRVNEPNAIPTPFRNNPFPNLPPGQPTPHP